MGIEEVMKLLGIDDWSEGLRGVDVYCDVKIPHDWTEMLVKFNYVCGNFDCSRTSITSLEGAPREVGGDFWCSNTKITSLEGCPREVGGDVFCNHTYITSLEGAPREVGGDVFYNHTYITSLEHAPREVGGDFRCYWTEIKGNLIQQGIGLGGD